MSRRFEQIINSGKPVLVDFYADWCSPCKMIPPILKEVKEIYREKLKVIKVNVDRFPDIAVSHQVRNIPTIILFHKGEIVWRDEGVVPVRKIAAIVDGLE